MRIAIKTRLRPFCHLPGTTCMVPWSPWKVKIFPTLLKFHHMIEGRALEVQLQWKGPIFDFTAELDLEKGAVVVFGHTTEGYRRAEIFMAAEGLMLALDKKKTVIDPGSLLPKHPLERLSLGNHKALDWELVRRRKDLTEILPIWHHLGQMVSYTHAEKVGTAALLQPYEKTVVEYAFLKLFMVGFEGIMVPRLSDSDHQGIIEEGEFFHSPLILLTEGAKLIRSFFFQETSTSLAFLPCLSPAWHAGRFVNLRTSIGDTLDFEWSKKLLRRVVIRANSSREVKIILQKPLASFRLRKSYKEKGSRWFTEQLLTLEKGQTLDLDRFETI